MITWSNDVASDLSARSAEAWEYFDGWKIYPMHSGIAQVAADVDREQMRLGHRLAAC